MKNLMKKLEELLEIGGTKKDIVFLVISGISLIISLTVPDDVFPFDIAWIAIILCGVPIILEAVIGLVTAFDIKADVLVSLALIASVSIGEDFAAGEVAFIMQLGGLLEDLTVAKAREGIEKLVHLTPQTARVIKDGKEKIISAENVKVNDVLKVLPGESIAVDGVIISGETSVNQSVMTGEPVPVDKTVGDEVSSGTVNQFGAFEMKAIRVGDDSSIQRMIKLVQSADAGKAKIVGLADRWATWIVMIALLAASLTWIISGEIIRAVTILVVFCPCSLVLATPTAIMAGIGNVTKHGFLVREGDALERLSKVKKICFDKTGTLTYGELEVTEIVSTDAGVSENELFAITASVESNSEHPLGKAVLKYAEKNNIKYPESANFEMKIGKGVIAFVNGRKVFAGNVKLMSDFKIFIPDEIIKKTDEYISKGSTVIFTAEDKNLIGFIVLSDVIRYESQMMIQELKKLGIKPVLLTGDNERSAKTIAAQVGITEIKADCLPESKLDAIDELQKNSAVAMIGDGINDAPALKKSDVGIAMGGIGSDIAVNAADIALINDEIKELPHLLALSKRMMKVIKVNLTFSMTLNFVAIILAIVAVLNPVVGALVHNCGSVLVIINSALLLKWRKK